jgi:hypothetical protein
VLEKERHNLYEAGHTNNQNGGDDEPTDVLFKGGVREKFMLI